MEDKKPGEGEIYEGMPVAPGEDMSRGTQTKWIVGTLIVIGLAILYFVTRTGDPCQNVIGWDKQCRYERAVERLNARGYY